MLFRSSAMRYLLIALLALLGQSALAADDATYRLMKLEQDVRNLERQVQTLTRQLDELKQQSARDGDRSSAAPRSATAPPSSTDWLEAARWDRVRPGMGELEVIGILGPPTSMRQEARHVCCSTRGRSARRVSWAAAWSCATGK